MNFHVSISMLPDLRVAAASFTDAARTVRHRAYPGEIITVEAFGTQRYFAAVGHDDLATVKPERPCVRAVIGKDGL